MEAAANGKRVTEFETSAAAGMDTWLKNQLARRSHTLLTRFEVF